MKLNRERERERQTVLWRAAAVVLADDGGGGGWREVERGREEGEHLRLVGRVVGACDVTGLLLQVGELYEGEREREGERVLRVRRVPLPLTTIADPVTGSPFKAEWSLVTTQSLFIGSTGKEWVTPQGETAHRRMEQVAELSHSLSLRATHNWTAPFASLRASLSASFPGYLIHEAVTAIDENLFFFPRRRSVGEAYSERGEEAAGTNVAVRTVGGSFERLHTFTLSSPPQPGWGVTEAVALPPLPLSLSSSSSLPPPPPPPLSLSLSPHLYLSLSLSLPVTLSYFVRLKQTVSPLQLSPSSMRRLGII
jgi:hypothetical protein